MGCSHSAPIAGGPDASQCSQSGWPHGSENHRAAHPKSRGELPVRRDGWQVMPRFDR
ncbi:hypothetical protein ACFPRL_22355 [Pseudoclavibacter helvolus]